MFSSGSQQGREGAEGHRQLILGKLFPQALGDRSKVSRKTLPGRMLLSRPQLEAALSVYGQEAEGEKEANGPPPFL